MNNSGKPMYHIGKVNSTNKNCVIVFPQNPHNKELSLVIDVDGLSRRCPNDIYDHFMNLIENEGQNTRDLSNLLGRKFVPDTNTDWMNYLAKGNFLQSVKVTDVTLYPAPNNPIPLASVLRVMDPSIKETQNPQNTEKFNQHIANQSADNFEENINIAKNILFEAEMLEADARKKREQAYSIAPSLKPAVVSEIADE